MGEVNWTKEAIQRISSIPAGFMQSQTRKRIEEHAKKEGINEITLEVAENVIETSRAGMGSMMGGDMSEMPAGMPEGMDMSGMMSMMGGGMDKPAKEESEVVEEQNYFFCFVCGYTLKEAPEVCPRCDSPKEKFSHLKDEFLTKAHTTFDLYWSVNANTILAGIPEGYQQSMTRWEVENYCRKNGYCAVTADIVEERIDVWKEISNKFKQTMEWDPEILERVQRIPESIRGMVMREMEVMSKDLKMVNSDVFEKIKAKWEQSREFHVKWM